MVDEYELNLMQRNGIFIDQLPLGYKEEALKHYPCKYCCNVYDEEGKGLHIYFHDDKQTLEYARSRIIWIKEKFFTVSLSATNLTVHGISASVQEILSLMKFNGYEDIVRVYPVGDQTEFNTHAPIIKNSDYRIVLKIPEINAMLITPITCQKLGCPAQTFSVTFFCRFCRQDGHKSFDCRLFSQSESFTGKHVERQMYLPSDIRNLNLEQFHRQGGITVDETFSISQDAGPHSSNTSDVFNPPASTSEACLNMMDPLEHTREISEPETNNPEASQQMIASLSEGIRNAIFLTKGAVLTPHSLIRFLYHARGRRAKTVMEIALTFTTEIDKLIHQLMLVNKNYFHRVETRTKNEDRDRTFLKDLGEKLQKQMDMQGERRGTIL